MKKKVVKKEEKNVFFKLLDIVSNACVTIIKKANDLLTNKKTSVISKVIIRIVCCLLLISVLEIPFYLIGKIGEGIISLCNLTFGEIASNIWIFVMEYAYLLVSLILLLQTITDMSLRGEYSFSVKKYKERSKEVYAIIQTVVKILLYVALIPLGLLGILLFALLGIFIGFFRYGVFVFGPVLIVIGLLIMLAFFASYLYDVIVVNKGGDANE